MAEFEGKRYKIVVDLHVFIMVDENSPVCPQPKLIKVKKPALGSSVYQEKGSQEKGSGLAL